MWVWELRWDKWKDIELAALFSLRRKMCLSCWYCGHWKMQCWTVSTISPWQNWQTGNSSLLIWNRCLLSRMCPVWSWVNIVDCLQSSGSTSFRYLLEGRDLSTELMSEKQGDFFHWDFQVMFKCLRWTWRVKGMLDGSVLTLRHRGSRLWVLVDPSAACLAKTSALSFGAKSWCPGVQCICTRFELFNLCCSFSASVWMWSNK